MNRRWSSFDKTVTDREFLALSIDDRIALFEAMKLYRINAGIGFIVKSYGHGLQMIKPKDGQGRCLFFAIRKERGLEELVALLAYKKGSHAHSGQTEKTCARTDEDL